MIRYGLIIRPRKIHHPAFRNIYALWSVPGTGDMICVSHQPAHNFEPIGIPSQVSTGTYAPRTSGIP